MARPGGSGTLPIPAQYEAEAQQASQASGLPLPVVAYQIQDESGWDPNVTSPAGAEGIAQFEPGTWAEWGHGSPFNAKDALQAYGAYSGYLLNTEGGDLRDELAAYNAGPGNLPAGYGYADHILGEAGQSKGGKGEVAYADPFSGAQVTPERIDQGVDFGGTGPVGALGDAVVTYAGAGDTGWGPPNGASPGGFVSYRLTSGPAKGRQVYVAEGFEPEPSLRTGQHITAGQKIGEMTGGGIETGWASGVGTQPLSQTSQAGGIGGSGPFPTRVGQNFDQLLVATGVPASQDIHGSGSGKLPSSFPGWGGYSPTTPGGGGKGWGFSLDNFPIIGPILSGGEDTAHGIAAVAAVFERIEHFIEWWALPSSWIRIFCGLAGGGLVIYGITSLARPRVNLPVLGSTPVIPGGELGPALGVASVTAGAVLLFFAFHNTGVSSWAELLSTFQQRVQHPAEAVPTQS